MMIFIIPQARTGFTVQFIGAVDTPQDMHLLRGICMHNNATKLAPDFGP